MYFNQDGVLSSLNGKPLKFVDQFTYLGSNVSIGEAWNAIDRLTTIWKSDLSDKLKCEFFQAVAVSAIVWLHHLEFNQVLEEKDKWELYKDVLYAVLNKSLKYPIIQWIC